MTDLREPVRERMSLRDGDIYSWRWKDSERHADNAPYRSYHCKSRIAVVERGQLYDTFWSTRSHDDRLDPERVVLTMRGNSNDMTAIHASERHYYRPEDVVDMRHRNDVGAPIYLKAGATRNAEAMRDYASHLRDEAVSNMRSAQYRLDRLNEIDAQIERGDIDAVRF